MKLMLGYNFVMFFIIFAEETENNGEGARHDRSQQTQHQHWNHVLWEGHYYFIMYL